jgi:hypothetical protein
MSDHEEEAFDIQGWISAIQLSEPGRRKLIAAEIRDEASLRYLTTKGVVSLKLAAAALGKFQHALDEFRKPAEPVIPPADASGGPLGASNIGGASTSTVQAAAALPTVPIVERTGSPIEQASANLGIPPPQVGQFSLDQVAGFLAGKPVPVDLNAALNNLNLQSHASSYQTPELPVYQSLTSSNIQPVFQPTSNILPNIQQTPHGQSSLQPQTSDLQSCSAWLSEPKSTTSSAIYCVTGCLQSAIESTVICAL